ncbi:MAG: LLM class flavin-dependent oxidoreductase [Actinomycetota bacterium]
MSEAQFGLNVSTAATGGADPVGVAKRAEDLGFDFVSASDHLHGHGPTYEPWTLLSWIAAATSRIRVATRVLAVPYRHPAVVAKMAETLDRLSGGRLILGLGGGWSDEEFAAFGLGVRTPGQKVDGLEEAIRVVRGLWSGGPFTFRGATYETKEAEVAPEPEHRIPIWLGTYGSRALDLTGRLADGWIPTLELAPPDRVRVMRDRTLAAARDAGRDPDAITCVYNLDVRVDERAETTPSVVAGPPGAVAERLRDFMEIGFTAMNFLPAGPDPAEQAERLGLEILPALRAA